MAPVSVLRCRPALLALCGLLAGSATPARVAAQAATLEGTVVRDSLGTPASGAEVSVPALGRRAWADSTGAFRLAGLPVGTHEVLVRALGASPHREVVRLEAGRTTSRRFVLGARVTVLDSVEVRAVGPTYVSPRLRAFEERRRMKLGGRFLSEAELRDAEMHPLSNVMVRRFPGLRTLRVRGGTAVASTRATTRNPCFVDVFVDGALFRSAGPGPLDIDQFGVNQLAGVEFYPGGATVPSAYNRTGAGCGVLLLWTRER
jgi:hypothetical protein